MKTWNKRGEMNTYSVLICAKIVLNFNFKWDLFVTNTFMSSSIIFKEKPSLLQSSVQLLWVKASAGINWRSCIVFIWLFFVAHSGFISIFILILALFSVHSFQIQFILFCSHFPCSHRSPWMWHSRSECKMCIRYVLQREKNYSRCHGRSWLQCAKLPKFTQTPRGRAEYCCQDMPSGSTGIFYHIVVTWQKSS